MPLFSCYNEKAHVHRLLCDSCAAPLNEAFKRQGTTMLQVMPKIQHDKLFWNANLLKCEDCNRVFRLNVEVN